MVTQPIMLPYFRIARPFFQKPYANADDTAYLLDARYAQNRQDLVRGYHYLQQELIDIFAFIEPADRNLTCFSYRLYTLLLRASTEFETNAKAILLANGYSTSKRMNIIDYYKINQATRLSEYSVAIPIWAGSYKIFKPFTEWSTGHTLTWYQDYNSLKHHRSEQFELATLDNVCKAVCAVFAIVFSQFHIHAFSPFRPVYSYNSNDGWLLYPDCLMEVEPASNWSSNEQYAFNWPEIAGDPLPFQKFVF